MESGRQRVPQSPLKSIFLFPSALSQTHSAKPVEIFDTTLRDGAQSPGISFSLLDKLAIARRLDALGFDYIEGGFPGSNGKDAEFFAAAAREKWSHARICAFGPTHHKRFLPHDDPALNAIVRSKVRTAVLFGKSSRFHAEAILEVSTAQNLDIIRGSVAYLTGQGIEVIFDAEHFFDGFVEDPDYALACLLAAADGGAINLTLADTNGGMLPEQVTAAVTAVKRVTNTAIGIHAHNDGDLAVANSLAAVAAGATLVQGTINGIGERCGNANLCSIIPNLQLKRGQQILDVTALRHLTETARFVQELGNGPLREDLPFVGHNAFRHKGGVHVSAIRKHPRSYEHIDPEVVGNRTTSAVSELSGKANIIEFLERHEIPFSEDQIPDLLAEIKKIEHAGLSFEGADSSLEILARRLIEGRLLPFRLLHYFVHSQNSALPLEAVEATVRVEIGSEVAHTAGIGNGPVNALDLAMRKALEPHFAELKSLELIDYKVRILDMAHGSSARIRVLIESKTPSGELFHTVGCSQNIIDASMNALADSYTIAIWKFTLAQTS